jgi:hypothetical protein
LVATMKMIKKDSRSCPKCGMAISKVDGCDQMFCTECKTAFSYTKGTIVTSGIHNPHYFDYLRKMNGGVIPPVPQEQQQGCGLGGLDPIDAPWRLPPKLRINERFMELFRMIAHHKHELRTLPRPDELQDNLDLRVKFLMKEIDEAHFKRLVQQRDKRRQKGIEVRATLELLIAIANEYYESPTADKFDLFQSQIQELVNEPLTDIGERYQNKVPLIELPGADVFSAEPVDGVRC